MAALYITSRSSRSRLLNLIKKLCCILIAFASLSFAGVRPKAPFVAKVVVLNGRNSMEGTLADGQVYWVLPAKLGPELQGKIVTWWWAAKQMAVVHRVKRVRIAGNGETYLITQGDANEFEDSIHVTAADFLGVANFRGRDAPK